MKYVSFSHIIRVYSYIPQSINHIQQSTGKFFYVSCNRIPPKKRNRHHSHYDIQQRYSILQRVRRTTILVSITGSEYLIVKPRGVPDFRARLVRSNHNTGADPSISSG